MTEPLITVGVNWQQIGFASSAILMTVIVVLLGFIRYLLVERKADQTYERERNALVMQMAADFRDSLRAVERYFRDSGR